MRSAKRWTAFFLGLMLCLLSGCWNSAEPKDLAIVDSIIYDYLGEGQYEITAELLNASSSGQSSSSSGTGEKSFITQNGKGPTLREALASIAMTTDGVVFGGHNHARFFTERLAEQGVAESLDYFARDPLTDLTPDMMVIEGDADPQKFFESTLGLSQTTGSYIANLSKFQPDEISKSVFVTTMEFIKDYYREGKQPVMGAIRVEECEKTVSSQKSEGSSQQPTYKLVYEGLAAFREDRLVGFLDGEGARAYNILVNKAQSSTLSVPFGGGTTIFHVHNTKAKITPQIDESGSIAFTIDIKVDLRAISTSSPEDITDPTVAREAAAAFDEVLKQQITQTVSKVQREFKSDIFGFGVEVHNQYPKVWKEISDQWDDLFAQVPFNVKVQSVIDRTGQIKKPLVSEK